MLKTVNYIALFAALGFGSAVSAVPLGIQLNHQDKMNTTNTSLNSPIDVDVLKYARSEIEKYSDKIPHETQVHILEQKIVLGMSPYEAKLAGGQFSYRVDPDRNVWPPSADPIQVIWHQSIKPDNSKIWMTFMTATQFPEPGKQTFTVYFENGHAVNITKNQ